MRNTEQVVENILFCSNSGNGFIKVLLRQLPSFSETRKTPCSLKFMFATDEDPLCPVQRKLLTTWNDTEQLQLLPLSFESENLKLEKYLNHSPRKLIPS